MTVRKKIALLITVAGFGASLIFSAIILWQMLEQPRRIIDAELLTVARRAVQIVDKRLCQGQATAFVGDDGYWLKIYLKGQKKPLYQSKLSKIIKLPEPRVDGSITVSRTIPRTRIELGQDDENEVTFRMRRLAIAGGGGHDFIVCVARPVEVIVEELWDISVGVLSSLLFSSLLLLAASYFVAGIILEPVRRINDQTREITERHLDHRIPVAGEGDEFSTLARTLNKVFERLQQAFLSQKRLVSDTSHELKTPLTMIRLSLDELRSADAMRGNRCSEIIDRMTMQTLRMERLIKNLLDLSALEVLTGMDKEPLDMTILLSSLLQDYQLLAAAKNIALESYLPAQLIVSGKMEKLERAFSNIIDNAIKYNKAGGRVEVRGTKKLNQIVITVTNTVSNPAEVELRRVFEPFYRGEESRALRYGGSGLGLSIVKRIIELHNGSVKMERLMDGREIRITVILMGL
ncbi:MAG TPA: HAMP domain-containing histidine kinase [Desulfobacterales bacterium]|nr:HAMP domain-containing histidine kinase [Desulfobacterales bacterium]